MQLTMIVSILLGFMMPKDRILSDDEAKILTQNVLKVAQTLLSARLVDKP